jgi:hypothetical protein
MSFAPAVDAADALDAFRHPFAYAAKPRRSAHVSIS